MSNFLDRRTLAKFLPTPQAISAFEGLLQSVGSFPGTVEEANALAAQALATAAQALAMLAELAGALEQLAAAPAPQPLLEPDDTAPRTQLGTLGAQNHDAIEITGGAIDGTPIGQAEAAIGSFTTLAASDQIISTVADGTPPLVVASAARVGNLNVERAGSADVADSLTNPSSFPADATDLASACALANALKAAAQSKGL